MPNNLFHFSITSVKHGFLHSPLSESHGPSKANGRLFWQWHLAEGIVPEETLVRGQASSEAYSTIKSTPFN